MSLVAVYVFDHLSFFSIHFFPIKKLASQNTLEETLNSTELQFKNESELIDFDSNEISDSHRNASSSTSLTSISSTESLKLRNFPIKIDNKVKFVQFCDKIS